MKVIIDYEEFKNFIDMIDSNGMEDTYIMIKDNDIQVHNKFGDDLCMVTGKIVKDKPKEIIPEDDDDDLDNWSE